MFLDEGNNGLGLREVSVFLGALLRKLQLSAILSDRAHNVAWNRRDHGLDLARQSPSEPIVSSEVTVVLILELQT
jgi:hypothetical protein